MRHALFIIALICLCTATGADFTRSGKAIKITENQTEWDLSATERIDVAEQHLAPHFVLMKTKGKWRLSEIIDGRRQRYVRDSAAQWWWTAEETRQARIVAHKPVSTNAFGGFSETKEQLFDASGVYSQICSVTEHGTYTSQLPVKGRILLGNDTFPATMSVEKRSFVAWIDDITRNDSLFDLRAMALADTLPQYTVTRHRWFVDGSELPVAVQTRIQVYDPLTDQRSASAKLYTIDHDDLTDDELDSDQSKAIRELLQNSQVTVSPGTVNISIATDSPLDVMAAISSPGGVSWLSQQFTVTRLQPIELNAPNLQVGRYVLALRCKKVLVKRMIVCP